MKKIKFILVALSSILLFSANIHAENYLNFAQVLKTYFDYVGKDIPQSYKYIKLQYKNLSEGNQYYTSFQKGVYLGVFPNGKVDLPLMTNITQKSFAFLVDKFYYIDESKVSNEKITAPWLSGFLDRLGSLNGEENPDYNSESSSSETSLQMEIMEHAYSTLKEKFIDQTKIEDSKLRYGAIQGMVKSVGEDYTIYFPPSEANAFNDEMEGDFEGIGAMVEMKAPGNFIITTPLKDSPAQKAGLLPGDQITKIDGKEITDTIDSATAVSWIKGPAGTMVILTIKRGVQELNISVKRDRIIVKNIESEVIPSAKGNICYAGLRMFGNTVSSEFDAMMKVFSTKNCVKYIFDLRNNPGGLLDQVSEMLNYFVPTEQPVAIVKSKFVTEEILSDDVPLPKITNGKKLYILINKGSASASEIFAGTIKDYYPDATIIGEKSFGKGSVQELIEYRDGSMLKYTMAKRYTGKTSKGIDKVGITPDVKIIDKTGTVLDEPLEFAKQYFK